MTNTFMLKDTLSLRNIVIVFSIILICFLGATIFSSAFEVSKNISFIAVTALFFSLSSAFQIIERFSPTESKYRKIIENLQAENENLQKHLSEIGESESESEEMISELKKAILLIEAKKEEYKANLSSTQADLKELQGIYKQDISKAKQIVSELEAKVSRLQQVESELRTRTEQANVLYEQVEALNKTKFLGVPLNVIKESFPELLTFNYSEEHGEVRKKFNAVVNGKAPKSKE